MNNESINSAQHYFDDAGSKLVAGKLQLLRAGSFHFGIFADEIATIVAWREPTPLPHAPKSVLGIVSLQGRMLTVLDLASLPIGDTALSDAPGDAPGHLIALRGDEQLALAVEGVSGTIEIGDGDFDGKPETEGTLVLGVLHREGLEIKILNLKELFPTAIQGRERRRRRF
ncbi:MAG: chemotaxis protein CheW [Acidobacteriota bacterium]|nr:chemotaxis protein CheW [Acidobacteriota bacterium]